MERILYVDDDDDDATLLETVVLSINNEITFTKSFGGYEALQYLYHCKELPDLIMLDLNMPRLNGFDFLIQIKNHERMNKIPVIMISTSASQRDVEKAKSLGATDFLTKPSSYKQLCKMMEVIINRVSSN